MTRFKSRMLAFIACLLMLLVPVFAAADSPAGAPAKKVTGKTTSGNPAGAPAHKALNTATAQAEGMALVGWAVLGTAVVGGLAALAVWGAEELDDENGTTTTVTTTAHH